MSLQAAAVGLGVALVPQYDLADEIAAGRLIVPTQHHCPSDRAYYFVTPQGKANTPRIAVFREWLLIQVKSE
ncbi:LysR family transcriptional regulator [Hylemonella gracilis ATCC 19624]|uniref:LysR family transcriptional regulator n=2 Tax=Hylemonella gracilis TaxID=80880 RepID=F3KU40_9BURK|nr:LysR family transcriptional regulator [Hylemonella gracilis ATCC 19624]